MHEAVHGQGDRPKETTPSGFRQRLEFLIRAKARDLDLEMLHYLLQQLRIAVPIRQRRGIEGPLDGRLSLSMLGLHFDMSTSSNGPE